MTSHDDPLFSAQALIQRVSPEFADLTADIREVAQASKDPALLAVLLFKLAQERQRTNQLLQDIYDKYDQLAFAQKTSPSLSPTILPSLASHTVSILPEADQKIMALVEEKKHIDAQLVKDALGYKNTNAASQRLNGLVKNGHLNKVQSGKKVVFLLRST
ncbi:MAG: hypothetical protein Q8P05_01715 [Candidatus Diapherotrites archaeon]|nr:hypothetical protein [Candidatus Diapherotrites archaeon]MDZ4256275.1 hypothetical protein [archaeon]